MLISPTHLYRETLPEMGDSLVKILTRKTWIKGTMFRWNQSCLRGHMIRVGGFNGELAMRHEAAEIILENFPERMNVDLHYPRGTSIPPEIVVQRFNDHPNTTFEEVYSVAEKLRAKLAERVE